MAIRAEERLILALDFPGDPGDRERMITAEDAYRLCDRLEGLVEFVKVGWPLYMIGGGQAVVRELKKRGKRVFLDLKFGDIPETVKRLVLVAKAEEVDLLTLNASMQAARVAAEARGDSSLKILTVTLLTSLNEEDLREMGVTLSVDEYVLRRMRRAKAAGCDGVVASGREAALIRQAVGSDLLIVTPGIRASDASSDDHKRAVTPKQAIANGADYLVVGRPITKADSPEDATKAILAEMQAAFDRR